MTRNLWLAAILLSSVLVSCTKTSVPRRQLDSGTNHGIFAPLSANQIRVVNSKGEALIGAEVLIGTAIDQPFTGNLLVTGEDGSLTIPADWQAPLPVTITASGYVRATFLGQMPTAQNFSLRPVVQNKSITLNGETTGFTVKDRDGLVDFGLVIPAITKQSFFNFDVSNFISKETDEISIIGNKVNIPKNVTLPKQRESYFIGFELNKPQYQLNFREPAERMIYVARGQFPIDEVIGDIRKDKPFYELAKYFSIKGGAVKIMNLENDTTETLKVDQLNYRGAQNVIAPSFSADELVFSLPLATWKGWYYPTDIKQLNSGKKQSLTIATGGTPSLLSILKRKDELDTKSGNMDRLSANFQTFTEGMSPSFLALMEQPKVSSMNQVELQAQTPTAGIFAGVEYSVLSKITQINAGGVTVDVLDGVWDVYAPGWTTGFVLPTWPNEQAPTGRLRWEVTRTGVIDQNSLQNVELGPKWLEAATHASRSSKDF